MQSANSLHAQIFLLVFPLHPDPQVRVVMERLLEGACNLEMVEALDYPDFVRLIGTSYLILTDSGGLQKRPLHQANQRS